MAEALLPMGAESATPILASEYGVTLSSLELKRSRPAEFNGVDHSPTAKKARVVPGDDTDTETADMDSAELAALRGRYKRDPTYYMEDGSCILLVEDTLFNVRSPHTNLYPRQVNGHVE
jgi:hypothetical protein